ncbi:MAG: ribonuclease P protein component [bacterium]
MANISLYRSLFSFDKKEIDWAFENAKLVAKTRGLKILQAPGLFFQDKKSNNIAQSGKLLIVVPRLAGKANQRNLMKRRIKAIFYENKLYENGATSIVLVRREAMELSFEQLQDFLVSSLR